MRVGVELTHLAAEIWIDGGLDDTCDLALHIEEMPQFAGGIVEAGDLCLTVLPTNDTTVCELTTAAGIKGRCCQRDLAGPCVGDLGRHHEGLGLLMTKEMHAASLPQSAASLLVEI